MAVYTIRNVDDDLWRKIKVKAASDGKPIRSVILELLTQYAGEPVALFTEKRSSARKRSKH